MNTTTMWLWKKDRIDECNSNSRHGEVCVQRLRLCRGREEGRTEGRSYFLQHRVRRASCGWRRLSSRRMCLPRLKLAGRTFFPPEFGGLHIRCYAAGGRSDHRQLCYGEREFWLGRGSALPLDPRL